MGDEGAEGRGYRDPSRPVVVAARLREASPEAGPARLAVFSDQSSELSERGRPTRRFAPGELQLVRREGGFGPQYIERLELRTADGRTMLQVPLEALPPDDLGRLLEALGGTLDQEHFAASEVSERLRQHGARLGPAPPRETPVVLRGHRPTSPSRGLLAGLVALATLIFAGTTALPRVNVVTWITLAAGLFVAGRVGLEGAFRRLFPQEKRLARRGRGLVLRDRRGGETPIDASSLRLGAGDPEAGLDLTLSGRDGRAVFAMRRASRDEIQAIRGLLAGARHATRVRVAPEPEPEPAQVVASEAAPRREREA